MSALSRSLLCALCILTLGVSAGCARFRHLRGQNARLDTLSRIEGKVDVKDWKGDPLMVVVLIKPAQTGVPWVVKGRIALNRPGKFTITLKPDVYMLGVVEDSNKNSKYDEGERAGVFKEFAGITLKEGEVKKSVDVSITNELPKLLAQPQDIKVVEATPMVDDGKVFALSDKRFDPETGPLGAWEPVTFQEKIGMGVFQLDEYAPDKIPVVFVHGMSGYPREFESLIKCLGKDRYQAWVAQYASGWALEPIARGLSYRLNALQRKHNFEKMFLVAHSMGGLVSRRMLREHVETNPKPFITKFVTIVSPLGGMPSADMGVKMAPAVVPSWRDIGPKSEYVKHLYDKALPAEIEYSLFFAFNGDDADDTVVALNSQLRKEARLEAAYFGAFQNTHTGVLKDAETCKALQKAFAR